MSEEQLKAFIAKAKDDQSIQEKLKAAKTPDEVVGIAREHGHDFATEHMTQLSEDELEALAGGVCAEGTRGVWGSLGSLCNGIYGNFCGYRF